MAYPTYDARSVAQPDPQVEARLAPERQRADLLRLEHGIDALEALNCREFVEPASRVAAATARRKPSRAGAAFIIMQIPPRRAEPCWYSG